jgi:hypothetical protein
MEASITGVVQEQELAVEKAGDTTLDIDSPSQEGSNVEALVDVVSSGQIDYVRAGRDLFDTALLPSLEEKTQSFRWLCLETVVLTQ